jgi:DNA polymerase-3 subunit delta'
MASEPVSRRANEPERVTIQPMPIKPVTLEPPLEHALTTGRVAHAYAFIGPPGSGRKSTARAFAQRLLGSERESHPDLHVIAPTPPPTNPRGALAIRIADVRALEHTASLAPLLAPWKVFIVEDADRMTGESPQAFLKTLEEPPPRTVIVLILGRARAVPATVLSRCQIVRFAPRPSATAADDRTAARAMFREVRDRGVETMLRHAQSVDRDRHRAEALVEAVWLWYRDLLRAKAGVAVGDEEAREAEALTLAELVAALGTCRDAWRALAINVSPRLTLEVLLSRLAGVGKGV